MKNFTKPLILYPQKKVDFEELEKLLSNKSILLVDQIESQLEELFFISHPSVEAQKMNQTEFRKYLSSFLKEPSDPKKFGNWVFYPWRKQLVHFLPEELHTQLRTSRNRNLITEEEQEKLYASNVCIAGLSIGNSAMATLLYTGGPKNLRLADFDTLSGSNLNRIRTSFSKVGMKKVEIAAEEIYEVNPYANLELFPEGVTKENLETFLLKPKKTNVLIEEMDNIYLKIQIRLLARKHRIPVIMAADNGDNIVLDIERYDLEPNRPILHGDIPEDELLKVTPNIPKPDAMRIISRWVHPENVADRMQTSLLELGKTLFTWPQLGNSAFLAGCALAYSAKKIILKQPIKQGKFLISLDEILIPNFQEKDQIKSRQFQTEVFKKALDI